MERKNRTQEGCAWRSTLIWGDPFTCTDHFINEWLWVRRPWVSGSSEQYLYSLGGYKRSKGKKKTFKHCSSSPVVYTKQKYDGDRNREVQGRTYSLSAWGSLCICSRIIRMAGSLIICCTSGSAIARFFTSSGLSSLVAWLTIQRCIPSEASW